MISGMPCWGCSGQGMDDGKSVINVSVMRENGSREYYHDPESLAAALSEIVYSNLQAGTQTNLVIPGFGSALFGENRVTTISDNETIVGPLNEWADVHINGSNQFDYGSHHYDFTLPLCFGCAPRDAFDVVRLFSAPGDGYAQDGTHVVTLTGNNPILQTVDPKALTILNTTLPGHVFHWGTVKLSILQDKAGSVSLRIVGNGLSAYSDVNQIFGPAIFFGLGMGAFQALNPNYGVNPYGTGPH